MRPPEARASAPMTLPPSGERAERLVGQRFGSFMSLRELGRGGMGTVLLAEHVLIPKRVAVKVLHRHLADEPELVSRFLAEARAMSLVQHENVVTVYDLDTREGRPYFVMEYLEGQSLAAFARGPLEPALAVELLAQVCDALGAAHARGIVHRDLKPANVFLVPGNHGRHRVKLLDFGIAKRLIRLEGETPTRTGVLMGTPEFMAPEQCGGQDVDARTDLYAVGVLGYLLLTGTTPFCGSNAAEILVAHLQQAPRPPHEVRPGIPPSLSAVLLRALAKRPEARYATAAELRSALEASITPARTPAPLPAAGFFARVPVHGSLGVREYPCERVGRTGLFVRTGEEPPPVLADVSLLLRLPGGELPCTGKVVGHVTAEQARAWNMVPGFGVELRDATAAFQQTFARLLAGEKPPSPRRPPRPRTTPVPSPCCASSASASPGTTTRCCACPGTPTPTWCAPAPATRATGSSPCSPFPCLPASGPSSSGRSARWPRRSSCSATWSGAWSTTRSCATWTAWCAAWPPASPSPPWRRAAGATSPATRRRRATRCCTSLPGMPSAPLAACPRPSPPTRPPSGWIRSTSRPSSAGTPSG
ncbi:protein kinase domain-containing protein [Archangium gephyra]|uniref:protein kinase domain-containing protein n=1 Tax=Archangium gephyra TaxID=48 RepID=UPI001FE2306C|nr:protein kinase [Archangium gephyra]